MLALTAAAGVVIAADEPKGPTAGEILAGSKPSDWAPLNPENTLYIELPKGRVVVELAPQFAPRHVANVKALAREHYYDNLAVVRVQENYVAQIGDPDGDDPSKARPFKLGQKTLPAEFDRPIDSKLPFTRLPDGDVYAREVGFSGAFPVARDKKDGKCWLVHTYGMVGAGRDNAADSGGGAEIYFVIGQAPRHLDRNVTLFGRVIEGMDLLSSLPRGRAAMGFYETAEERTVIQAVRVAADVPEDQRSALEVLRTDTPLFERFVEARRNRREKWFLHQAGRIEIASVPLPVRNPPPAGEEKKAKREK
jgi:peptidylprolyl isomerase